MTITTDDACHDHDARTTRHDKPGAGQPQTGGDTGGSEGDKGEMELGEVSRFWCTGEQAIVFVEPNIGTAPTGNRPKKAGTKSRHVASGRSERYNTIILLSAHCKRADFPVLCME